MVDEPYDRSSIDLERHSVRGGGVDLHVRAAGPERGDLVLLLHGFPEFWYGWRHQIPPLAEAGYRVLIPDQRGYNRSDAPSDVASYDLDRLATDVQRLIEAAGRERAHVVGHDWGAVVAWYVAMHRPEWVRTLAILNGPHPAAFWHTLRTSPRQVCRSLYMLFFQIPVLPERLLGAREGGGLATLLRLSGHPDARRADRLAPYRRAWTRPGRLRGMLHWYRAGARRLLRAGVRDEEVRVPTLVLWGRNDAALSPDLAFQSADRCADGRVQMLERATHWVQHDAPRAVNDELIGHFPRNDRA